jgi:monoamine oxidase
MAEMLNTPVQKGKRVIKIGFADDGASLDVLVAGEDKPRSYDHVVSTLPFGCLRQVDTSQCLFSWKLQTAIRTLHYDTSVKVGIQFKKRWWEEAKPKLNHKGGVSSTDRSTRTVVYPSYGIGKEGTGATMIASYTWAQDAARMGALVQEKGSPADQLLLDLIIGDLAVMHNLDPAYLRSLVIDHQAFDWYNEPNAAGKPISTLPRLLLSESTRRLRSLHARAVQEPLSRSDATRLGTLPLRRRSGERTPRMGGWCAR